MDSKQKNQLLLISLARITFLSLTEKLNLLKKLDTFNDLALLSLKDISELCGRPVRALWNGEENLRCARREQAVIAAKKINMVFYYEKEYPALLRESANAPFVLFYIGNIDALCRRTVSVVGTRHVTPDARIAAESFARDAVLNGETVVSGLAFGVDSASHKGAVDALAAYAAGRDSACLGKTVAVLPCGIDTVIPSVNRRLAEKIIMTGGALVSEYVPGVSAERWRFVQRNRIIAALSPVTVVVQAPAGSGALITADFALEAGRDVVFHKAAFSSSSVKLRSAVEKQLEKSFASGKISKAKFENRPEKYLASGAAVIESYQDYCNFRKEPPGERSEKYIEQYELF